MSKVDAIAYIEWGGQYDRRELELMDDGLTYWFEDLTGGHLTLHDQLLQTHTSAIAAVHELIAFCMALGESCTYINFGPTMGLGIVRSRDYCSLYPRRTPEQRSVHKPL